MAEKEGGKVLGLFFPNRSILKKAVYPGLFLFAFISLALILSWQYLPSRLYREGVLANRDIQAVRTFQVENRQATIEAQNQAMNSVEPVYFIDPFIINQVDSQIKNQFNLFAVIHQARSENQTDRIHEYVSMLPIKISEESLDTFTKMNLNSLGQLEINAVDLALSLMKNPIRENDEKTIAEKRKKAIKLTEDLNLPEDHKAALSDLLSAAIRPNARVDWDETYRLRQLRKEQVNPVMTTIHKGQVIVEKNKIITPQHMEILEVMGVQRSHVNTSAVVGILIFVLLLIATTWIYIYQYMPHLASSPKLLLLLTLIVITTILLCRLLINSNPYLIPIPAAAILITILIGPKAGFLATAYMSIIIGLITGEFQFAAVSFIAGTASVLFSSRAHKRMDLVATAIIIFFVNVLTVLTISLIQADPVREMRQVVENLVFAGINGFGSGIVSAGLLPVLEYLFGITTAIKLLEISNQSEPLLKRLLLEAPGTYHHSVIVGNLAEAAAQTIGEDPMLCRVGAYYHDIGKLRRPYFFIENQLGGENPHDKLSPNLSALIILSHVKDGVDLALKHKLPEPVVDIIAQHHGTSIIAYFYHQAKKSDIDFAIEEDFRYSGPQPQSKAATIVMLADSVEAAARTIDHPTPSKIENLVRQIVKKNLEDGQLDDSPLSLKDINNIIAAFTKILTGIYHQRIEYPDRIMEEITQPVPMPAKVTHIKKHA